MRAATAAARRARVVAPGPALLLIICLLSTRPRTGYLLVAQSLPPHELESRPIIIERRNLYVDEARRQDEITQEVLRNVTLVAPGLARPRDPNGRVIRRRPNHLSGAPLQLGGRPDEYDRNIERPTETRLHCDVRRQVRHVPSFRRTDYGDREPGPNAEFLHQRRARVPRGDRVLPFSSAACCSAWARPMTDPAAAGELSFLSSAHVSCRV
jgi:hypothetical protein